ncbi:hypothetical protein HPB49_016912 [Dermacentor silvarum]|uniref:Uncharacterized protein n=1 Tax=Dermacentor silvarum TaxID=543639 RepID=A0ACB8D6F2_DERSI|nr:hypothetical protein HPB49_016912 [Dermacentor silvarum]
MKVPAEIKCAKSLYRDLCMALGRVSEQRLASSALALAIGAVLAEEQHTSAATLAGQALPCVYYSTKWQKKKMMSSLVLVTALALPLAEAFAGTVNPNYYEIVSLNDFCDNKENKKDLRNTTQSKSAAIVTATQFRDMRGSIKDGCSIDLSTKGTAGLIVSLVEMNLRSGVLNRSCIDYVNIVTKFHIPSDKDERCGRVRADEYRYFATSQSLQLRLHSRTPLSTFFDGYTLAVVVTSFTEASSRDGGCAPHEFQCVAGGRCIYKHYQCDNINNCGDNSDEEQLGNSMCREHRGRFRNALVVPPLFAVL